MIRRALAFLLLAYALGYAAFVVLLPGPADDRRTDGIVVLTGGAKRLERGLDLMARQRAGRMLVSGVERTVRAVELAERYDADIALFDCCIELGRESVDTRSNGTETARWAKRRGIAELRLVTTDWHMPRALFEMRRQLGDGVAIVPDAVESEAGFQTLYAEYNKYLLRRAAVIVGL